jgi:hypothetical protein
LLGQDYRIMEFLKQRLESHSKFTEKLLRTFSKMKYKDAKATSALVPRQKSRSKYFPHYGENAAARNFKHAQNATHGLYFADTIKFN